MATEDKQGNLHSDDNGQFVGKNNASTKEAIERKYEKYAPQTERTNEKTEDKSTIKEQVTSNLNRINATPIVAEISQKEITADFQVAQKRLKESLLDTGGSVERHDFGVIKIDGRIKQAGAYLKSVAEISALAVIPEVLKGGVEIATHSDHKGRQYKTWTIAGRVNIAGKNGIVAVVVKETTDKFYKVHRVFTPNGDVLRI